MENVFVDGAIVTGDSFIGREAEIHKLESMIFNGRGAVHLVDPTRIGKSSLAQEVCRRYADSSRHLLVKIVMSTLNTDADFWKTFVATLKRQLKKNNLFTEDLQENFARIAQINFKQDWYELLREELIDILEQIQMTPYRIILIIDEFDYAVRVFEKKSYQYQFLRSIFSDPEFASCGIIISRRRLNLLEESCEYISTFHGIFSEMPLHAFSDADMKDFHEVLELFGIEISPDGKEKLDYYTGRMPHLCSGFARRMVDKKLERPFDGEDIKEIFRECIPQIERHYDDLIKRLREDGYLDFIFYLSIGAKVPRKRSVENMQQMGVLAFDEKSSRYYSFSKDFMAYLREKHLDLPTWDLMMSSEKKLKAIFKREYPELDRVTYNDLKSANASQITRRIYPALNLNWGQITKYCEELSERKENPTALNVITLSKIISVIIEQWTRFFKYFNGDAEWKNKLNVIKGVRNPMAHANLDYVSEEELAICLRYCEEVIRL